MVKARSWDAVGIVTVGLLGILGVRRRSESTFLGPRTAPTSPISGRCIVTGASSGMGTELVNELVNAGAEEVVMACRSLRRCEKTRELLFRRCLDVDKAVVLWQMKSKNLQETHKSTFNCELII